MKNQISLPYNITMLYVNGTIQILAPSRMTGATLSKLQVKYATAFRNAKIELLKANAGTYFTKVKQALKTSTGTAVLHTTLQAVKSTGYAVRSRLTKQYNKSIGLRGLRNTLNALNSTFNAISVYLDETGKILFDAVTVIQGKKQAVRIAKEMTAQTIFDVKNQAYTAI
jgi:ribosomal protein S18